MRRLQQTLLSVLVLGLTSAWIVPAAGADKKVDPTGTWKWERTRRDNTRQYTLRIKLDGGKVSGTYASRRGETDNKTKIENGKMEGDQLSFQVIREFNGRKFTIHMQGKVSEDTIKGSGEFSSDGGAREFTWEAQRFVETADVLGTWRFRIEIGNGNVLEPTVTLVEKNGKLEGVYTGRSVERDAKHVVIKNNQLIFEVSGENNGNEWKVTYQGHPRGNSIRGTIDYDFGGNVGTVDFAGKRDPEKKQDDKNGNDDQEKN